MTDQIEITVNSAPVIQSEAVVKTSTNQQVSLQVAVIDDGLGNPATGGLTVNWQPSDADLEVKDSTARQTTAIASKRGRYPLDLTVSNGFASTSLHIQVLVFDLPVVKSGENGNVFRGENVALNGKLLDNGLNQDEPGPVILKWELVSGPGALEFSDPAALDGTVHFPQKGVYLLRLTTDNGFFQGSDTIGYTVNQEPQIQGAANQETSWNTSLLVTGQVIDDGRCDPAAGEVTAHWSIAAGPQGSQIESPDTLETGVSFSQKGIYTLRLEVSNGFVSSQADVRIVVNQPPQIDSGANQTARPGKKVSLRGEVLDNGLGNPSHSNLSFNWTQISGPKDVKFSNASDRETLATLTRVGTYIFQFKARYGELSAMDQVQVVVAGN